MSNSDTTAKRPRHSMRERSARRFEHDIARACHETFIAQPWFCSPPLKASTYIQRFRDARLAFRNGTVQSNIIPADADTMSIKLHELANGTVQVVAAKGAPVRPGIAVDDPHLPAELQRLSDRLSQVPLTVFVPDDTAFATLQRLCDKLDVVVDRDGNTAKVY